MSCDGGLHRNQVLMWRVSAIFSRFKPRSLVYFERFFSTEVRKGKKSRRTDRPGMHCLNLVGIRCISRTFCVVLSRASVSVGSGASYGKIMMTRRGSVHQF